MFSKSVDKQINKISKYIHILVSEAGPVFIKSAGVFTTKRKEVFQMYAPIQMHWWLKNGLGSNPRNPFFWIRHCIYTKPLTRAI